MYILPSFCLYSSLIILSAMATINIGDMDHELIEELLFEVLCGRIKCKK